MSCYLPYASTHSIQEAVVGIHFQGEVSSETVRQALDRARSELRNVFPHSNETRKQGIKIDQGNLPPQFVPSRLVGFELSRVKANARPACVLRLSEDALTVNFLEYKNWRATLEDSQKYINTVLPCLKLATTPVMAFSLRYIDRYTFDGPHDEARAELLLQGTSAYMTSNCFRVGPLWHCHSGWLEILDPENHILNQLNIGSAHVDRVSTVTIDHNAICQLGLPRQTAESIFRPPSGEKAGFEKILNLLHDRNGEVLRDMLLPEMAKQIGLQA